MSTAYERRCKGKAQYDSQGRAEVAMMVMEEKTRDDFVFYVCPYCRCYHIGHAVPEPLRRYRAEMDGQGDRAG
jgi:hypothetical protein